MKDVARDLMTRHICRHRIGHRTIPRVHGTFEILFAIYYCWPHLVFHEGNLNPLDNAIIKGFFVFYPRQGDRLKRKSVCKRKSSLFK